MELPSRGVAGEGIDGERDPPQGTGHRGTGRESVADLQWLAAMLSNPSLPRAST